MTTFQIGVRAAVWAALGTVRDPELDEPLTDLGFVARCVVDEAGRAEVELRLPTYFCAPNFAFLMVADAYDAVAGVPGLTSLKVKLIDHFAADVINRGVAARQGFVASFEGEAADELDTLRGDFVRKAVSCPVKSATGSNPSNRRCDDDCNRCECNHINLAIAIDAPSNVTSMTACPHSTSARLTRTSMEANSGVCRGMLRVRYPQSREQEGAG